jgi:hypothetical protein
MIGIVDEAALQTDATGRSKAVLAVAFALGAAILLAAILVPAQLPFVDFPQHVALLSRWTHAGEAVWGLPPIFELNLATPYVLSYAIAYLLSPILGDELAIRVVLAAGLVGLPAATWLLLRAFGRPTELCLAVFPVALSWLVYRGWFPFVVGLPLAVAALAVARYVVVHGRTRDVVILAILAFATLATHALAFALLAAGVALVAVAGPSRLAALVRVGAALAPAVIVALAWVVLRGDPLHPEPRPILFGPLTRRLDFAKILFGAASDDPRVLVVVACLAVVLVAALVLVFLEVRGDRPRDVLRHWFTSRLALIPVFLGAALASLLLPETLFDVYGIWQRAVPMAFVLGLGLLPWPGRDRVRTGLTVALAVVAVVATGTGLVQGLTFSQESTGIREIIKAFPPGARIFAEAPTDASNVGGLRVYRHIAGYYVAAQGGEMNDDFSLYPYQIVTRVEPGSTRYPMRDYEVYLFRASPECPAPPPDRPIGRELARIGEWSAYEIIDDPARPGPTAWDLPCYDRPDGGDAPSDP